MLGRALVIIFIIYLVFLWVESYKAKKSRSKIKHVIYVNGTRGKSSVTRLIYSGLKAGGYSAYAKTTGTLPMIIDTKGDETLIKRRGSANIKEQVKILKSAAEDGAEVLVIECMALQPELQYISQHSMVNANIGVITNVRPDHLDVMGETLEEIGESLSNTIPKNGVCFTADKDYYQFFSQKCKSLNTKPYLALPDGSEPRFDFSENIALALAVCNELGVESEVALKGMENYTRDPYALSLYKLKNGAIFIGGLAINDPVSTEMVYTNIVENMNLSEKRLILLISTRQDRAYRTKQHRELAERLKPSQIWLIGRGAWLISIGFKKHITNTDIIVLKGAEEAPFHKLDSQDIVFAIGNIGEGGSLLMERIEKEGTPLCITKLLY